MQIGTQSEYSYGSFNRNCDDGVCDDKKIHISAPNKKEFYCQGGTPKDYKFDVKACVYDKKLNSFLNNQLPVIFIVLFYWGMISCAVRLWQNFKETQTVPIERSSNETTKTTTVKPSSFLPFESGYCSLPIHVDKADFVDFTRPASSQMVWFGLTTKKMTTAAGKVLCEKYPGLNVVEKPTNSPYAESIVAMVRKYVKQGEFGLSYSYSYSYRYFNGKGKVKENSMLSFNGKWERVSDNAEGFVICEFRLK
jgi:hypothetical protein